MNLGAQGWISSVDRLFEAIGAADVFHVEQVNYIHHKAYIQISCECCFFIPRQDDLGSLP